MQKLDRRSVLKMVAPAAAAASLAQVRASGSQPNVLFIMTDQQRFDTIAALGNSTIYTPNLDRLVNRGVAFTNAYSSCPVCVPARYTIRTGCEPHTTRIFQNAGPHLLPGQPRSMTARIGGPYLAQTMQALGYRTFGIGKFHSQPWNEPLGYDTHLHSEELYGTPQQRRGDAFASWIAEKHPEYDFLETLMGERTEMYYMPQMRPLPASIAVEGWAAARTVEQLAVPDTRPYFGFVSFVGPHPPIAPPLPFNRLYDPDRMANPVRGDLETDHMDEQIPFMNYTIWAEDINDSHARVLRARYYGEITYIDDCLGRILDAVEKRGDAENTLICFFADHGDHLGDHSAWQKESFFEASCHVPFLVSWPAKLAAGKRCEAPTALTDLFGIATKAAGKPEFRQGFDALGIVDGSAKPREHLFGFYGEPGTPLFKVMVRGGQWKYIFMANGGREQLFNLHDDPQELTNAISTHANVASQFRAVAEKECSRPELAGAMQTFPFKLRPRKRTYQFDHSRGVTGFPQKPQDVLKRM
jgi:choline-sulfatase